MAGGFSAVAIVAGEGPFDPAVERLDGGIEHPSGGVEVVRPKGIRVAR